MTSEPRPRACHSRGTSAHPLVPWNPGKPNQRQSSAYSGRYRNICRLLSVKKQFQPSHQAPAVLRAASVILEERVPMDLEEKEADPQYPVQGSPGRMPGIHAQA